MKSVVKAAAIVSLFASAGAFAHHPAEDIVDPEIYEMIDDNVADTPHADLVFGRICAMSIMDTAGLRTYLRLTSIWSFMRRRKPRQNLLNSLQTCRLPGAKAASWPYEHI